ncbi:MAG: YIP1 family protein [Clostridia bacterium]|nr:YIP1 family protein [Clostridia bacterium]
MKKFTAWLLILLTLLSIGLTAQAATPFRTFTLGTDQMLIETQTAYDPVRTMIRFGDETLKNPQDMRMGPDGYLYIADNGNKRILVVDTQGNFVREIVDKKNMKSPMGVFVDDDLNVYVADDKARAVLVYDKNGKFQQEYTKPTHQLFGATAPYVPQKVVLDKRGNLYIVSKGNTNGIVQISPVGGGEFLGYYGANASRISFLTHIRRFLFGENSDVVGDIVPISVKNLAIDQKGMVYTVTEAGDESALRRLNVAGKSTIVPDYWIELNSAVAVNSSGSIFTANANGTIMEYTSEGALLFVFGANDELTEQRIGMFKSVTGLVVTDDYTIYVLDATLNSVQVLRPTEFTDLVHEAFTLFQEGKYAESKAPWLEVLRMNSMFTYASTGLGEALYREDNYAEAMENFRNGGYRQGYSDAWWEERSNWLHSNMSTIILVAVVVIAVWIAIKQLDRHFGILKPVRFVKEKILSLKLLDQVLYCFQMLKNPYDTCYGIKREKRASYLSAVIVLFVFFVFFVLNKYFAGFLFKTMPDGYYELLSDFLTVFGAFLLLTICCYLVCTITDGEARFRDIFISAAYALAPMIVFQPIVLVLSNVLTFNEEFFITLLNVVSLGWTALLIVLMLMYQNDYTLKKTFSTIFMTLFCVLVVVALIVVLYMLISQLVDFIVSIYGEVVYRFVKRV